jgi:hypothetical protein
LIHDLRYEEAIQRGLRALRDAQPVEERQISNIYGLLGVAHFNLGNEGNARTALVQLFALHPEARPPEDVSPKLNAFWDRIRLEAAAVALDPAPLREVAEARPIPIDVRVAGPGHFDKLFVHFRLAGAGAYAAKRMDRQNGRYHTTLPGAALPDGRARDLEYWLEARDASGVAIAMVGTEVVPQRVRVLGDRPRVTTPVERPVVEVIERERAPETVIIQRPELLERDVEPPPPPRAQPIYKKWWFWGLVGVGAAAVGTGIYLGTRGSSSPGLDICVGVVDRPCSQ